MGPENDLWSRKISRRNFLRLSAATATSIGAAYLASKIPELRKDELPPLEEYDKFLETVKNHPTRFYYHNGANNPERLERALASPAVNIEADVINFNGELYIAHSVQEFLKDITIHPNYLEEQKVEKVFRKIVEKDKNPALDIKLSQYDQECFKKLNQSIRADIPEDRIVTFSGEPNLVFRMNDRPNSIVVPTINPWQIYEYMLHADNNWINSDPDSIRYGATLGPRFWDDDLQYIIGFNRERKLETNIYSINNEQRIITLLNWGATGITSDEESIFTRACV